MISKVCNLKSVKQGYLIRINLFLNRVPTSIQIIPTGTHINTNYFNRGTNINTNYTNRVSHQYKIISTRDQHQYKLFQSYSTSFELCQMKLTPTTPSHPLQLHTIMFRKSWEFDIGLIPNLIFPLILTFSIRH